MNDRRPPANGSSSSASVDGRWSHLALVLIQRLSVCYAADHVTNPLDVSTSGQYQWPVPVASTSGQYQWDVVLAEFMYIVFTRMPCEKYLRSWLFV